MGTIRVVERSRSVGGAVCARDSSEVTPLSTGFVIRCRRSPLSTMLTTTARVNEVTRVSVVIIESDDTATGSAKSTVASMTPNAIHCLIVDCREVLEVTFWFRVRSRLWPKFHCWTTRRWSRWRSTFGATVALTVALSTVLLPIEISGAAPAMIKVPTGEGCQVAAKFQPRTIVLSCADGNAYFGSIEWSSWGSLTATGSGRYMRNTCIPDCAGGTIVSRGVVTLLASDPGLIGGLEIYTRLMATQSKDHSFMVLNWSRDNNVSSGLGTWNATTRSFVPMPTNADRTALLKLLEARAAPNKINYFRTTPSPIDPTWVLYHVGIPISPASGSTKAAEDLAEGFAHFVHGKWDNVLGPGSGFCLVRGGLRGVPTAILKSYKSTC